MRRQFQQLPKRQRGAVAVVVGIAIFVLVGMIGLALDSGQLFVNKTELQNAADACALAAARELDGTSEGFARGDAVGKLVGRENLVGFQKTQVSLEDKDITYSDQLDSGFSNTPANSTDVKFAKCEVARKDIGMWFMGVFGYNNPGKKPKVGAYAVATLAPSQTTCAIPVGMCSEGPAPTFGLTKGQWYSGKFEPSTKVTGSFNWIDFDLNAGGTPELRNLLAGTGQCELPPVGKCLKEQGQKTAVEAAWNTRFGIYQAPYSIGDISRYPPDYTGSAYIKEITWKNPPIENSYSGVPLGDTQNYLSSKKSYEAYPDTDPVGIFPGSSGDNGPSQRADSTSLKEYGTQRRVVLVPILNCGELATGSCIDSTGTYANSVALRGYACVLMLSPINGPEKVVLEYLGQPDDKDSPCSSFGLAGNSADAGPLVPVLAQ